MNKTPVDLAEMDTKVPGQFIISYKGKPYIVKAGLEWKAAQVFGIGGYSLTTNVEFRDNDRITVKAEMNINDGGQFSNYGEVNRQNTTPEMYKNALHLAATRAECRVLRMATACGYVAYEEMEGERAETTPGEDDNKAPTGAQMAIIKNLLEKVPKDQDITIATPKTQKEARDTIDQLHELTKGK